MTADPLAFIRGAHFAATLLASGTVCFMAMAAGAGTRRPPGFAVLWQRLKGLVWIALALTIVTGAMWLIWLASNILGEPLIDVVLHAGALSVLADTRFGWVWCARAALVILLALLVLDPKWRVFQVMAAAALLVLPAFVGHAGAAPGLKGALLLVSDAAHLMAAGAWLGALPAFAMLLWAASRNRTRRWSDLVITATRRFSMFAVACVGILLMTGIGNSWSLLGGVRDLWTTDYGRLIGFKVLLFAAMVAIASVNKFHLTPRLAAPVALRKLRRNSFAEIGIGLCVLALVGFLGRMQPTAHVHPATATIPAHAAFTHIHAPGAMADVTIDPGRVGRAKATIRVSRENFSEFAAKDVRLTLEPPVGPGGSHEYDAERHPDGTWTVSEITLVEPGRWMVRVTVTPRSGEVIVLDAPIVVER